MRFSDHAKADFNLFDCIWFALVRAQSASKRSISTVELSSETVSHKLQVIYFKTG